MTYVIPHFTQYLLYTQKGADFFLWARITNIINQKEHLTDSGFLLCLFLAASVNNGLSDTVKFVYPLIEAVTRSIITTTVINPFLLSGFTAGDDFFNVSLPKRAKQSVGYQVLPVYQQIQDSRDKILLIKLLLKELDFSLLYLLMNLIILLLLLVN